MSKQTNYFVIGGQYASFCYGGAATLLGAKRLAGKNVEYWDNWQGWHVPSIYRAEDTMECENFYGCTRCPKDGAFLVDFAWYEDGKIYWEPERMFATT